jgi:hypothetical protein
MKTLTLVCAWCQKTLKKGDSGEVSHGICDACLKKEFDETDITNDGETHG